MTSLQENQLRLKEIIEGIDGSKDSIAELK